MTALVPSSGSALQARLKGKGLLPSTRAKYQEIIDSAQGEDLVPWLRSKLQDRTPIGTVLPMRAAVKHYLIAEEGYSEEELRELLPRAQGKNTDLRDALTPDQLAAYHTAVDGIEREPAKTILSLLPKTGLRIGEACALKAEDVPEEGESTMEFFSPSGQKRVVPLVADAAQLLRNYAEARQPREWLFTGYDEAKPITAHALRKYTRRIAETTPELDGLTPSTLRHTFAVMALKKGTSLEELKEILGHGSLMTTKRYQKSLPTTGSGRSLAGTSALTSSSP
jgi:integrase